ncbi:MAG: STAS domain-containing protein [Nitrospirales bacterium]
MLTVTQESLDGATVLNISGRFEFTGRKVFTDSLRTVLEGPVAHVILNFQHVPFVDSAALGLLALAHQNLKLKNARVSIANPQDHVKRVFELANLQKIIPMYPSIQEAARSPVMA